MKTKVTVNDFTNYQLGILFACGSITNEKNNKILVIRHKNKYFLEQLQNLFDNKIGYRQTQDKNYYILKTKAFDFDSLENINHKSRNAKLRYLPILDNYKDFLRAYIELHACWDYCVNYTKRKEKYYRLRLRIYGNFNLISEINQVLNQEASVKIKSIQSVKHNDTTSYIAYTSVSELYSIRKYLEDEPCNQPYWNDVDYKLKNPRKEVLK